jgi:ABC-type protease/lipase transport system fused ATPase/permease subunit
LPLAVWIGGLIFFPVVAQISFTQLPSPHLAGAVVRGSLIALHWMGLCSGLVFLVCSLIEFRITQGRVAAFRASHVIVVIMMAITCILQFVIIPRMDALRAGAVEMNSMALDTPLRQHFDSLHGASTRLEGAVLLLGIVLLYLTTRRLSPTHA